MEHLQWRGSVTRHYRRVCDYGLVPKRMFLQFFAWGSWFATLGLAMTNGGLSDVIGGAYEAAPIAAIFAPLFLGLVADRLSVNPIGLIRGWYL